MVGFFVLCHFTPTTRRTTMDATSSALVLILITLVAGTVNGALGYGFSSITVPVALLFYANRVLNPALVWIEVVLNAYVLWVNRASVPHVWRRVVPMIVGLAPGVALGTSLVHRVQPGWLKLATFIVLLPLILLQAAGFRRPIRDERRVGLLFGGGLGVLYSVTTISGPPLAVMLSNQGFTKQDFRAGLGLVRLAESTFTAVAYYFAGMFSIESAGLLPYILPSLVVGIPLGVRVIRHVRPETFRRVCMSFDAWVVGFGISTLLRQLHVIETDAAFSVLAAVGVLDIWLLYRFFRNQTPEAVATASQPAPFPLAQ
ncbi:MAG: hypothetical protein DMD50_08135 [Gemmatimonadetes bacterium]|nr:MAG: hypothetical protein DMD50_08135 [Gemmatimonadota bacterium]